MTIQCHYCFSPQSGDTALHKASWNSHLGVIKLLLESHANVNVKDNVSIESSHYSGIPLKQTPLGPKILSAVAIALSLAQELMVDHAPPTIAASYDKAL